MPRLRGTSAVTLDVHLQDGCVVHKPVDGSQGHGRIDEHFAPLRERSVRRDRQALVLVTLGNELEEHRGFGLVASDVTQIVQDQQIEPVELGQFLGQAQIAPCGLQPLHEIAARDRCNA